MSSVHKSTIENLQKKNSTSRERRNEPVLIGHLGAKKTEVRILQTSFDQDCTRASLGAAIPVMCAKEQSRKVVSRRYH